MTHFDLQKDTAKVKFILEKKQVPKITAEVVAILDVSGSTQSLYLKGTMQEGLQRIVPVALNFDDNGSLPVYVFSDGNDYSQLKNQLTSTNYKDFITNEILFNQDLKLWGSTDYEPVLWQALHDLGFIVDQTPTVVPSFFKSLFNRSTANNPVHEFKTDSKSHLPAIIYFITDGENSREDKAPTRALLEQMSTARANVYFNFIGVGEASFSFLKEIGDAYPNTGFAQIKDIARTAGSDEIYEFLIPDELTTWLRSGALTGPRI